MTHRIKLSAVLLGLAYEDLSGHKLHWFYYELSMATFTLWGQLSNCNNDGIVSKAGNIYDISGHLSEGFPNLDPDQQNL